MQQVKNCCSFGLSWLWFCHEKPCPAPSQYKSIAGRMAFWQHFALFKVLESRCTSMVSWRLGTTWHIHRGDGGGLYHDNDYSAARCPDMCSYDALSIQQQAPQCWLISLQQVELHAIGWHSQEGHRAAAGPTYWCLLTNSNDAGTFWGADLHKKIPAGWREIRNASGRVPDQCEQCRQ